MPITLQDIDDSFDAIFGDEAAAAAGTTRPKIEDRPEDRVEVEELFRQIAAAYLGPVRDFMVEMQMGDPPKDWLQVCEPAVASLSKSASGMGLTQLSDALGILRDALQKTQSSGGKTISEAERDELTKGYQALVTLLPDTFTVEGERDRREPIIVQSLLKQIPDVRKVALDKIYAAGISTLKMFYVAKAGDIADATGLSLELAQRIVDRFVSYRRDVASIPPAPGRNSEHELLEQLLLALHQQNDAFEGTSKSWSDGAISDKRRLRQIRNDTVLQIQVILARLGEIGLVQRMEKMPFLKKAEELVRFLAQAKAKANKV